MEHLLEAQDIKMYFGGVHAVDGINMYVDKNEMLGIIGPNGSGKTTFFNALTGIYKATSGRFIFKGQDITNKKLQDMSKYGIARTFQNLRIFRALTVKENVLIGEHINIKTNAVDAILHTKAWKARENEALKTAEQALEQVGLDKVVEEIAGSLPYGMQKRLELARALVTKPELLLLDEPTGGMNSVESTELMGLVKSIQKDMGISVILIEHNMKLMMKMADRILAMDAGKEIAHGIPEEVQVNPEVIRAYLGEN